MQKKEIFTLFAKVTILQSLYYLGSVTGAGLFYHCKACKATLRKGGDDTGWHTLPPYALA